MRAHELFRQRYGTTINQDQILNWIWYDTLTYTSATTTLLTFFNAVRATRDLGNLPTAGQLPHPMAFIIRAIRVHFKRNITVGGTPAATAASDLFLLINNGWAELTIGQKNFGIWPLTALPGGAGVAGHVAAAGAEAANEVFSAATHGVADPRAVYTLSQPLMIDPVINFQFTLNWATAQTLTANVDILVMFDGELFRPVQ